MDRLVYALEGVGADEHMAIAYLISVLGKGGDPGSAAAVAAHLDSPNPVTRDFACEALGNVGGSEAVTALLTRLEGDEDDVREAAIRALGQSGDRQTIAALLRQLKDADERQSLASGYARRRDAHDQRLLSRDVDAAWPWLDPRELIMDERVHEASAKLNLTPEGVRSRYEAMAGDLGLKLSWRS